MHLLAYYSHSSITGDALFFFIACACLMTPTAECQHADRKQVEELEAQITHRCDVFKPHLSRQHTSLGVEGGPKYRGTWMWLLILLFICTLVEKKLSFEIKCK